jgi:glycosyltransferase involved in cell wall biosynthesis
MIKVITTCWNCSQYISKCIESVRNQTIQNFKMYIIDDLSDDGTSDIILSTIKNDDRFIFFKNEEKKYKLKNLDELIIQDELFDDEDIIIELDGDDYLFNNKVFERILKEYENKNVKLTNGSFMYVNGSIGFSSQCNPKTIRKDVFTFSHLRTFKRELWMNIPEEQLKDDNGEYFKSGADVAYSFPLIEIAGEKGYRFIPDILYVYNHESPFNDHKPDSAAGGLGEQSKTAQIIRNRKSLYE